jgi:hypothetical protein
MYSYSIFVQPDVPISNFPLKQKDGTGCLNMKEFVISVETELEMNSIICSSVKNRKLKPLGKSPLVPVSYLSAPFSVHSYRVPGKFIRRLKSLFV